jgi:ATP-dependent Clp protease adaptor protein ClpS
MTTETVTEEKTRTTKKFKEPGKYNVIVINDDYTPVEFVIALLIRVFRISNEDAYSLTMKIHHDGSAIAGVYSYEVAEQKVMEATELSRLNGHPLILKASQE